MIKRIILCVLLLSFVLGGTIYAQEETKEPEESKGLLDIIKAPVKMILAPVKAGGLVDIVTSPAEKMLSPITELGEIVITPGRTEEYVFNINKNISVITSEDIEDGQYKTVQQAIARETGVSINGFLNNAKDNNIDMRGFGEAGLSNYVVLMNGRRTNQIDLSGADLAQVDTKSIDRIEIVRGPNSVMYGDNATGGIVNIITKTGREGHHAEYTQELGSYQYNKEFFSLDGKDPFMDYFLSYSYQDSEGYRLNNSYEANDIHASFNMKPEDSLDLHMSTGYHRDWYGQPGAMYCANIRNDGKEGSRFPNSKAKTEDYYFTIDPAVSREGKLGEVVVSVPVSYRSRRTNSVSVSTNTYETNHHISSIDMRPKCEIKSSFFDEGVENKTVFGADYFFIKDQILSGDITVTKQQYDILKETFGIYAENNMLINKRFLFNGGIRGEWAEYVFDQDTPAESYNTNSLREAAADLGIGYKYNEKSQVYANFARSYRYPATDEYFSSAYEYVNWMGVTQLVAAALNTSLKQQTGNNYEIGIKDNSFGFLNLNASYYYLDNKNEIYYDTITYQNENYHHTVHHGLELETHLFLFEKIKSFFSYTFQKAFFVGGKYAGKNIPLVPQNKISAGFNAELLKGLDAGLAVNYTGTRFITSDQINEVGRLKPFTTVDATLSYEIGDVRVFGKINNLFDANYYSNAIKDWQGNIAYYPAPDRSFEFGVSYRF